MYERIIKCCGKKESYLFERSNAKHFVFFRSLVSVGVIVDYLTMFVTLTLLNYLGGEMAFQVATVKPTAPTAMPKHSTSAASHAGPATFPPAPKPPNNPASLACLPAARALHLTPASLRLLNLSTVYGNDLSG